MHNTREGCTFSSADTLPSRTHTHAGMELGKLVAEPRGVGKKGKYYRHHHFCKNKIAFNSSLQHTFFTRCGGCCAVAFVQFSHTLSLGILIFFALREEVRVVYTRGWDLVSKIKTALACTLDRALLD